MEKQKVDRHKNPSKTIRLDDKDREAIAILRKYYGITSDTQVIRIALQDALRKIQPAPDLSKKT